MPQRRLGILVTHPIQYFAPLYRELSADPDLDVTVYFAHRPTPREQGAGFGVAFTWDVDLTSGYRHVYLRNRAARPGEGFRGYDTPEIADVLRRERYDALLVSGWHVQTYLQAILAAWRTRTPLLVRGDSQLVPLPAWKRVVKRAAYPVMLRRFDVCLSVGERSEAYFRHYGARRIVRSPHFVDNEAFAQRAAEARTRRDAIRAEWNVSPNALVALFAGKFIREKQPQDLVRALAGAGAAGMHGVFVGDGALRQECERLARELGVRATFLGFRNQTQMADAYAGADVLVLPSISETWGLVVNEAMASGLPAIVSEAAGCAPDLVIPGRTGYRFRAGDVRGLQSALIRLLDPELRSRLAREAASHVSAYSVRAAADGVRSALDVVAPRGATALSRAVTHSEAPLRGS